MILIAGLNSLRYVGQADTWTADAPKDCAVVPLRGVATLLTGVFSLPVLSGINGALGAVFDVLMLVLILWVVLACTQVFVPMLSAAQQVKVQAFENTSMLLKLLGSFNPAYHLMQ